MSFPQSLDALPPDWRIAMSNRRLLWEGGYDPALIAVRDRDRAQVPMDGWYFTFMWLFYCRDPQECSDTNDAFTMPENWRDISIPPAPAGQLPTLRAALADRFSQFYHVETDDPVVKASVEYAFSKDHRAGPIGYLAAASNSLWVAANRWRKYQGRADKFPLLRLMADDHLSARTDVAKLDGVILPVEHEFWGACFPPNHVWHVGMVGQVTERMMRQKGWTVTEHLPDEWRSLIPTGFDRNFAALWPNVIEPGLVSI